MSAHLRLDRNFVFYESVNGSGFNLTEMYAIKGNAFASILGTWRTMQVACVVTWQKSIARAKHII